MLKFGDRVTAPRSWVEGSSRVTGVIINIDEKDERGWWYHVCCPDGPATWTHKDETVLEPDPERGAQDERIAQLTLELANTQATITALKALVISVSDASAAKEQVWSATEHYNAKAERAREALAAFQKLDDSLHSERGE